jgi:hypothetical protein
MTTEEKLRIIGMWSYSFETHKQPDGKFYGKTLVASYMSFHHYTDAYDEYDEVIDIAFYTLSDMIWKMASS